MFSFDGYGSRCFSVRRVTSIWKIGGRRSRVVRSVRVGEGELKGGSVGVVVIGFYDFRLIFDFG